MKRNQIVLLAALIIFSVMVGACTRSASGGAADAPEADTTLPNPVSTQSQLMKDIIAGTQTAMAVPLDATPAAGTEVADTGDNDDDTTVEATPKPVEVEATAKPLPTSTPGPAPVVTLEYNTKKCGPGVYICTTEWVKDQTVTVQGSYPWLLNDMELTFKMGPEGMYDFSKYIVVGTSTYKPEGGQGFKVTLNVPDSLRGTATLVVLLETNDPNYYGSDYYSNK